MRMGTGRRYGHARAKLDKQTNKTFQVGSTDSHSLVLGKTIPTRRAGEWPSDHLTRGIEMVLGGFVCRIVDLSRRGCRTSKDALKRRRLGAVLFGGLRKECVINE